MAKALYNVALTESEDAKTHHWDAKPTEKADGYIGSALFGKARIYVANGVVAHSVRDAKAHALELWESETKSNNPTMTVQLPAVRK